MSVISLTGLIVCPVAPLMVGSRRITGKVGWYFPTVLGTLASMAIGKFAAADRIRSCPSS